MINIRHATTDNTEDARDGRLSTAREKKFTKEDQALRLLSIKRRSEYFKAYLQTLEENERRREAEHRRRKKELSDLDRLIQLAQAHQKRLRQAQREREEREGAAAASRISRWFRRITTLRQAAENAASRRRMAGIKIVRWVKARRDNLLRKLDEEIAALQESMLEQTRRLNAGTAIEIGRAHV